MLSVALSTNNAMDKVYDDLHTACKVRSCQSSSLPAEGGTYVVGGGIC